MCHVQNKKNLKSNCVLFVIYSFLTVVLKSTLQKNL